MIFLSFTKSSYSPSPNYLFPLILVSIPVWRAGIVAEWVKPLLLTPAYNLSSTALLWIHLVANVTWKSTLSSVWAPTTDTEDPHGLPGSCSAPAAAAMHTDNITWWYTLSLFAFQINKQVNQTFPKKKINNNKRISIWTRITTDLFTTVTLPTFSFHFYPTCLHFP